MTSAHCRLGTWLFVVEVLSLGAGLLPSAAQQPPASVPAVGTVEDQEGGLDLTGGPKTGTLDYQDAINQAIHEFSVGHWEEAAALFRRAHAIQPSARTLRGMGMAAYEGRDYVEALRHFHAALNDSRKALTERQRNQVRQWVAQAEEFIAKLRVVVVPGHAELRMDGQTAQLDERATLALNPGPHEVGFSAPGYVPVVRRVTAQPGQHQVIHVHLQPTDGEPLTDNPLRLWGWSALGGAALFAIAASVSWFTGAGRVDDVKDTCRRQGCTPEQAAVLFDEAGVDRFQTATNLSWALSGASLIAAGTLFFIDESADERPHRAAARLDLQPSGLHLTGCF